MSTIYNVGMRVLTALTVAVLLTAPVPAHDSVRVMALQETPPVRVEDLVDPKEKICLQKNIYFEARNQGRPGMRAVAAVTLNRVEDPRFPNTVCRVVYQRKQFSWANRGDRTPNLRNIDEARAWAIAGEIAEFALKGEMKPHGVQKSQYSHTVASSKPRSWPPMNLVATVGDHVFYYQNL